MFNMFNNDDHLYRITFTTMGLMLGAALFSDFLQMVLSVINWGISGAIAWIPFVGTSIAGAFGTLFAVLGAYVGLVAWVGFYVWFKVRGIKFMTNKVSLKFSAMIFSAMLELAFSFLPATTAWVLINCLIARHEDKAKIKKLKVARARSRPGADEDIEAMGPEQLEEEEINPEGEGAIGELAEAA